MSKQPRFSGQKAKKRSKHTAPRSKGHRAGGAETGREEMSPGGWGFLPAYLPDFSIDGEPSAPLLAGFGPAMTSRGWSYEDGSQPQSGSADSKRSGARKRGLKTKKRRS